MINVKNNFKVKVKAEILLSGQSLSFKLDEDETIKLIENLEDVSYDFQKFDTIKLFHRDGRLKSIINPLQISRIWFSK